MENAKGETILFCSEMCSERYQRICGAYMGMNIEHVEMDEDWLEEHNYIIAHIYCERNHDWGYYPLREEQPG